MKPIKMFGLAALAALMAMAFVGATSAMATEPTALCSVDPGEGLHAVCPEGNLVEHVHETSVGKGKLLSSAINVECDVLFLGDVLTEGLLSEPPAALLISGNFTYTNCNSGCVVTEENGPVDLKVLKEAHELGKVTGEGLVHVNCSGFINCRYNGEGLVGHALGPLLSTSLNGNVTLSEQSTTKESGFFCPATAKLDLTTTPLTLVWLAE